MSEATDREPLRPLDRTQTSSELSLEPGIQSSLEPGLELSPQMRAEIHKGQREIARITRNNLFGHCQTCEYEWVGSAPIACPACSSDRVEFIACWQFPDG